MKRYRSNHDCFGSPTFIPDGYPLPDVPAGVPDVAAKPCYCDPGVACTPHCDSVPDVAATERETVTALEVCWLIERGQAQNHAPTVWWMGNRDAEWGGFTPDALKAIRYPSREAAEAVIDDLFRVAPHAGGGHSADAVEHAFSGMGPRPSASVPVPDVAATERETLTGVVRVAQQDDGGCAPACLAMLTGRTYLEARDIIDGMWGKPKDWASGGCSNYDIDRALFADGYFTQRRYVSYSEGETAVLPFGVPFAPLHYAMVEQSFGNHHFVVMLADGTVLDSLREGSFVLSDWPRVLQVVGLVRP